jgi:hypothetical protein
MDGVISPLHFLRGLGLVGATVIVQAIAQIALTRLLEKLPTPRRGRHLDHYGVAYVLVAVVVLMLGMVGEIGLWALLYYYWGELGGFANSVYFSLASFTTVGASDLTLSSAHRMVGALESAVGMLMFGWSTALLFEVIQSTRSNREGRSTGG